MDNTMVLTEGTRRAPLALNAAEFTALGHMLVDQIAALMESIPAGPVTQDESPSKVREALDLNGSLPETGTNPAVLLASAARGLFEHSLFNAHPRFFGYITSSPAPIGVLGDLLASALNANVGAWALSPAATEIEAQTVRWLAEFVGYRADCGGLLVSGGNMANFACFLAARASQAGWDVRSEGVAGSHPRLCVYASQETHTWVQKATDLAGLGTQSIRWIPVDSESRMDVDALRARIDEDAAAGNVPMIVVGNAGSVSTGAVDPLPEIAAVCRERGIWFHVDGAYGGFATGVPGAPVALHALADADSVAVDPHKWLYAPLEAGCALVRDAAALRRAFSYHPVYYHLDEDATNYVDYGPQNSRGFRALKVWLALRQAGAAAYRQMLADDMRLSRALADAVSRHEDLELVTQSLSIATFRYVPRDLGATIGREQTELYLNRLNEALLDRIQRGGEAFVSNAVVGGRYVLRACIVNFHTDQRDIDALPEIVVRAGRALHDVMRRST